MKCHAKRFKISKMNKYMSSPSKCTKTKKQNKAKTKTKIHEMYYIVPKCVKSTNSKSTTKGTKKSLKW